MILRILQIYGCLLFLSLISDDTGIATPTKGSEDSYY
jgi:hypothetical protein